MAERERKTFDAAEFKVLDDATGTAELIASVFGNVDAQGERVLPGFFADSLARRRTPDGRPKAKGVWGHDWLTPIAKTLDAQELLPGDPRLPPSLTHLGGLWVKGQFNLDTQPGREAYSNLKFGAIDEFSIGYRVLEDAHDKKTGVRDLVRGEWYEWSPVLVGANDATELLSIKSADDLEPATLREVLAALKAGHDLSAEHVTLLKELHPYLTATLLAEPPAEPPERAGQLLRLQYDHIRARLGAR